jgi:hypothetical protein
MDPLRFAIAATPLAVYLLLIGLVHLRRRPFVTSGARDTAALGIAIVGLAIVGPLELFFPEAAASRFGPMVWLLMIAFFGLCVSMIALLMRPRLVVYGSTREQLRPILANVAIRLDQKARWFGDHLIMPALGVQFSMEGPSWLNNIHLVAVGRAQNFEGWKKLETDLRSELNTVRSSASLWGVGLLVAALAITTASILWMLSERQQVTQTLIDMLRW